MELLFSLTLCDGEVSAVKQKQTLSTKKATLSSTKTGAEDLKGSGSKMYFQEESDKGC